MKPEKNLRFFRTITGVFALLLCWGSWGCGGKGGSDPDAFVYEDAGVDSTVDGTVAPFLVFEMTEEGTPADFGQMPFPSDLFLDSSGRVEIGTLPAGPEPATVVLERARVSLNTLDGFGATTAVFFPVAGDIEEESLEGRAHLVDLEQGEEISVTVLFNSEFSVIAVRHLDGMVLQENKKYGVWLDTGIQGPGGPLKTPDLLRQVLDAVERPAAPDASRVHAVLEPLLEYFDDNSIERESVAVATVFTVQSITKMPEIGRRAVRSVDPPEISVEAVYSSADGNLHEIFGDASENHGPGLDPGYERPSSIRHDNIGFLIHGSYETPYYLADIPNRMGHIEYTEDGTPVAKAGSPVFFTLALPDATDYADVPLVIYQHGITRGREDALALADVLAEQGVAVIAIDLPFHGSRRLTPVDNINNITQEPGADGFGDIAGLIGVAALFDLSGDSLTGVEQLDFGAARDNLRQASLDLLMLVHLLDNGDWSTLNAVSGLENLSFNTEPLVLIAKSFGCYVAITAASVEPRFSSLFLSVPPAGLLHPTLNNSPIYAEHFFPVIMETFNADPARVGYGIYPASHHPVVTIWQMVMDSVDPLAFTPYLLDDPRARGGIPPHVAIQIALDDEQVPNQSAENLVYSLGLPLLTHSGNAQEARFMSIQTASTPVSENLVRAGETITGGAIYFTDSTHNLLTDRFELSEFEPGFPPVVPRSQLIDIENDIEKTQRFMVDFIMSALGGSPPVIEDPYR